MTRLKEVEIHNLIQKCLRKRPMSTYQITTDLGLAYETIKKHLEYLEAICVIEEREVKNYASGKVYKLWYNMTKTEQRKKVSNGNQRVLIKG